MQVLAHKVTVKVGLSHDRNNDLITIKCMLFFALLPSPSPFHQRQTNKRKREKRCYLNNGKRR